MKHRTKLRGEANKRSQQEELGAIQIYYNHKMVNIQELIEKERARPSDCEKGWTQLN